MNTIVNTTISTLMTLILLIITSFFIANVITPKKDDKYNFLRVLSVFTFFYLLSKINKHLYEWKSIIMMLAYIVSIFALSKDKWYKKILIFIIVFGSMLLLNGYVNDLIGLRFGYSRSELKELLSTTEGYYYFLDLVNDYAFTNAMSGLINIASSFIFITLLLLKNKNFKSFDIFLNTFFITFLSVFTCILSLFYMDDMMATITLAIVSTMTVFISIYSYKKLEFYQIHYKQEVELKYLKDKEVMQYEYYKQISIKEEEIRKINHDIRNDLQVVVGLKNEKDRIDFINKINDRLDKDNIKSYSKNEILNILLNIKSIEAKKYDIDMDINIGCSINFMEDIDICNLFTNIIDNAIEASKETNDKKVSLLVKSNKGNINIIVSNSFKHKNKLFLSNKGKNHGYGLKIIDDIVSKYNGDISYTYENNIFELVVMIAEK
ncbi:MAG: GHKL domain-containing protein [Bacilli bacterium]|nr:GHKL domain-containing protein [Bacilli bacterium]